MIAAYAAKEVDGVSSMEGGQARDFLDKVGVRSQTKGVKVEVNEHNVKVALSINMGYGYNIPATSSKVQARVKQAIESMTGLHVTDVNVRIAGISIPSEGDVKKD
ncbi:MAG: Asp23/Gls24 family envelope stress response protein [Lachnospiraceae bacterium]|nr:Asp23/Gls24 family envelope stress response protein [Lachnospiraceae bacterium]